MDFHDKLRDATAQERAQLLGTPLIHQALAGEVQREQYIAFLTEAYHHVKHTVPLMMHCGGRLPDRLEWLRVAVAEYIEEEIGHHEWILNDIAAAGGDREAARTSDPALATELMVAYAYDTVQRRNPVGFFGMVLVLEGTSVALAAQAANSMQQALGLPARAFTYLATHGSLDAGHTRFYAELMNRLDDPHDQAAVTHCARVMYRLYGDIFRSLPQPELRRGAA